MVNLDEIRGGLLVAGAAVVATLAIIFVQPGLPGELLLQSLRFHIGASGLALTVVLFALGVRWRGLLLGLVTIASLGHGLSYVYEFQSRRIAYNHPPEAEFSFLSFNVLSDNARSEELVDAVLAAPPDVMLVMEAPGVEDYLDRLGSVLPYRLGCDNSETCDIALLSRFPFEDGVVADLPPLGRERIVVGRISVGGKKTTIMGVHLSKPYYDNTADIELWRIDHILKGIEGPVVLAGDFNSAAWTDPVARVGRRRDLAPGPWQPATWPVRLGPLGVPIDNMFTRGSAQIISLEAGDNNGSNHRPLWATVGLYAPD